MWGTEHEDRGAVSSPSPAMIAAEQLKLDVTPAQKIQLACEQASWGPRASPPPSTADALERGTRARSVPRMSGELAPLDVAGTLTSTTPHAPLRSGGLI